MTKININWLKIIGNAGMSFFLAFTGLTAMSSITNIDMSLVQYLICVIIVSGGQAGVVFFRELTKESENNPPQRNDLVTINPENITKKTEDTTNDLSNLKVIHHFLKYVTI